MGMSSSCAMARSRLLLSGSMSLAGLLYMYLAIGARGEKLRSQPTHLYRPGGSRAARAETPWVWRGSLATVGEVRATTWEVSFL